MPSQTMWLLSDECWHVEDLTSICLNKTLFAFQERDYFDFERVCFEFFEKWKQCRILNKGELAGSNEKANGFSQFLDVILSWYSILVPIEQGNI